MKPSAKERGLDLHEDAELLVDVVDLVGHARCAVFVEEDGRGDGVLLELARPDAVAEGLEPGLSSARTDRSSARRPAVDSIAERAAETAVTNLLAHAGGRSRAG